MIHRIPIVLAAFAVLTLACSVLNTEGTPTPTQIKATDVPASPIPAAAMEDEEGESPNEDSVEIPYPVMDNATQIENNLGVYSYVTEYSVQEVVDFYKEELPEMDLTLSSETVGSNFAVLQFEVPGDHPITLNIITNDAGLRVVRLTD